MFLLLKRTAALMGFSVWLTITGCSSGGSGATDEDEGEEVDPTNVSTNGSSTTRTDTLNSCRSGFTAAQVDDTLRMAHDYNNSLHELVACGNMTFKILKALSDLIEGLVTGAAAGLPPEVVFDGQGYYNVTPTGYDKPIMAFSFYVKTASTLGAVGDLIKYNLFDKENYLKGVNSPETSSNKLLITYTSAGPIASLLGLGDPPSNPISLDSSYILKPSKLFTEFRKNLEPRLKISIEDVRSETTNLIYDVESLASAILSLFDSGPMAYNVLDVEGDRTDNDQMLDNQTFDVEFVTSNSGVLDGSITFDVVGGIFDYSGTLTYDKSGFGALAVQCLNR